MGSKGVTPLAVGFGEAVMGQFGVTLRQASFFALSSTVRVHFRGKKLAFLV